MQRFIPVQAIYQMLPQIVADEPQRMARIKFQIKQILEDIADTLDHESVRESVLYQIEQLDNLEDSAQLTATLGQVIKQKQTMIDAYRKQVERYKDREY